MGYPSEEVWQDSTSGLEKENTLMWWGSDSNELLNNEAKSWVREADIWSEGILYHVYIRWLSNCVFPSLLWTLSVYILELENSYVLLSTVNELPLRTHGLTYCFNSNLMHGLHMEVPDRVDIYVRDMKT